jgi:putative transposase
MPQSLANVLLHIVFSTKVRVPLISPEIEEDLWAYLATVCRTLDCPAHAIGGMPDHVHIACSLSRTTTIADLLNALKSDSSKWIKALDGKQRDFAWQAGYGAFSIGQSQLDEVRRYIARQKEHHRVRTFQDEFREMLQRYEVPFDERYVWD